MYRSGSRIFAGLLFVPFCTSLFTVRCTAYNDYHPPVLSHIVVLISSSVIIIINLICFPSYVIVKCYVSHCVCLSRECSVVPVFTRSQSLGLTLEYGADGLSRNVGHYLPINTVKHPRIAKILLVARSSVWYM